MTSMAFILQFRDSVVKSVQLLLQFLNFVLNGKTPTGIFVNDRWLFFTRYWQAFPLCAHGPSESRIRGYANPIPFFAQLSSAASGLTEREERPASNPLPAVAKSRRSTSLANEGCGIGFGTGVVVDTAETDVLDPVA